MFSERFFIAINLQNVNYNGKFVIVYILSQ